MRTIHRKQNDGAENRKRILILSCSGGAGHVRAAEALHRTAPLTGFPVETIHHDVLDLTTPLFKRLYSGSYLGMVNRIPDVWGFLYQRSERSPYRREGLVKLFDRLNYRRYLRTVINARPDAIVCTHFLPYLSVSTELRAAGITAPVYAVTTDFDVHQLWIDPIVDVYTVFHEESAWQLHSKGVPSERIRVRGIPVQPEFRTDQTAKAARRELGIPAGGTTIMVLAGGFGVGRIEEIVRRVIDTLSTRTQTRFTVLAVCGRNDAARRAIASLDVPKHITVCPFGFVDNVHVLMSASDLLVSKSGGLTSSEALAKGLPMLIIDPIPGQESRNADLIVEHGAGWKAINLANLSYKLTQILDDAIRLQKARAAARRLGRPDAAETILQDVVRDLQTAGATR